MFIWAHIRMWPHVTMPVLRPRLYYGHKWPVPRVAVIEAFILLCLHCSVCTRILDTEDPTTRHACDPLPISKDTYNAPLYTCRRRPFVSVCTYRLGIYFIYFKGLCVWYDRLGIHFIYFRGPCVWYERLGIYFPEYTLHVLEDHHSGVTQYTVF